MAGDPGGGSKMVTGTTLANDAGKFIQDELIARSELWLRLTNYADDVELPKGMGKIAYFMKYNRMNVSVDPLTEGVTPGDTGFDITQTSVTLSEWGMYTTISQLSELTTKHPVMNEALDLLADAIARMHEFQLGDVLMAGTNVQYSDGSGSVSTRGGLGTSDKAVKAGVTKATVTLGNAGSPPREGEFYVVVCSPEVLGDLRSQTGDLAWNAMAIRQDKPKYERGVIGDYEGCRFVRSNFLPRLTRIATASVTATTGGSMSGTVYHKVTRRNLQRGFEEAIQVENSTALGANTALTCTCPSTAGYTYNIYVGSITGDANLFLAVENAAASSVNNILAVPTTGTTAPATPAASITIHPAMIFASKAVNKVPISAGTMTGTITPKDQASDSDPLKQRRKMGSKYFEKFGIRDQDRFLRWEVVSAF